MLNKLFCKSIIFIVLLFSVLFCKAEGSKDLYPSGAVGNRAFLVSSDILTNSLSFPFFNFGTHYAYVATGEVLAVASSAQGIGSGHIRLTSPTGTVFSTQDSNDGAIKDQGLGTRAAELGGPRVGYTPYEITIDQSTAGIWKIEFLPCSIRPLSREDESPAIIPADDNWTQSERNNFIAAWDVSVYSNIDKDWKEGRVYTNILNLQINSGALSNASGAFYGRNYVMTNDGYVYQVNGNGSNGIAFSYFVNNKGFLDSERNALYRSVNSSLLGNFNIHDPRNADLPGHITHKMMYNRPALDLPETAVGAVPGGSTWLLKRDRATAVVNNIRMIGAEGTEDYVSARGSKIYFSTNLASNYKITVASADVLKPFVPASIIVDGKVGVNEVLWNGKDGNGAMLPIGEKYPVTVKVELLGGEVHFPYIDMEINPNGIIIQLLHDNMLDVESDIVYWDDSEISMGAPGESSDPIINLSGISSRTNGHRWGTYRNHTAFTNDNSNYGGFSFGNEKAMDTWAYALTIDETVVKDVTVKVADLKIDTIATSQKEVELGETVVYEVVVANNGPSDVMGSQFDFTLPTGFIIKTVSQETNCGVLTSQSINGNAYHAQLDLTNQCKVTFKIEAVANYGVPDGTYGVVEAFASILRPRDTTDPDATSILPLDNRERSAIIECQNNGIGGRCNNISWNFDVFLLELLRERGSITLLKEAIHLDENGDRFKQVGETLQYIFTIQNNGFVTINNLALTDPLFPMSNISLSTRSLRPNEEIRVLVDYIITKADFDNEYIENSAFINGLNPRGFVVKDLSGTSANNDLPTITLIEKKPLFKLKKSIVNRGSGTGGMFTIDDEIIYNLEVLHEGDIPISSIRITDPMISNETFIPSKTQLHNETTITELRYTVTMDDIERGSVTNSATVRGTEILFDTELSDVSGLTFDDDNSTVTQMPTRGKAIRDVAWLYQNNFISISPLVNDQLGTGEFMLNSLQVTQNPLHGTFSTQPDGSIIYTPDQDYIGVDSLRYKVLDSNRLWSLEAYILIDIRKTTPVAVIDYAETWYNHSIDLNITQNDYVDGAVLDLYSIEILSNPSNGTLVVLENGRLRYEPFLNFNGLDEFTYRIKDSNGWISNDAKVTVLTKGFLIPNAFSPNGDGINDTFQLIGTYLYDYIELSIYNRAGNLLYINKNYQNDWDAQGLSDGTYLYLIKGYSNGEQILTQKGAVAVIRKINY